MDFSSSAAHQGQPPHHPPNALYGQPDLDNAFSPIHSVDNNSPAHPHISNHSFDQQEGMDVPELFTNGANNFSSRYRASSASSSGPSYGLSSENVYNHTNFGDSQGSFGNSNGNPYELMSVPSSYSSGKVSPLSPTDPMTGIQQSPVFPQSSGMNGSNNHSFSDILQQDNGRRIPSMSGPGGYHSEPFQDDFAMSNGGSYPPSALHHFQQRMSAGDPRFAHGSPISSHMQHGSPDLYHSVSPQDTNPSFRPSYYSEDVQYMQAGRHPGMPMLDFPGMRPGQPGMGASNDLQTFIRPYLDQYVRTPNRLAFGERTVIVMSSKVAQKSYGTEKRFLCPPPTAIMIGNSWWTDVVRRGEEPKLCPPRVTICISGEPVPQEGSIEWTSASGKIFDVNDAPTGTTYIGRCVGKQLFISDVDEKKKKVEALVKITAPSSDDEPERVIGTFPSRPIKVISKPSKKRQSAKNLELCINHGSTISLFHRLRSQTVSTKYLCVSGSGSSFKGSDGAPLMGIDARVRSNTPSFIARTASWDPFVMYIVDVNKPAGGLEVPPPPPPQPDYPSPPPNAIPFPTNGSQIPIYYNQTVVLQCLVSGVVSPVLIIRKVDHQTTVVGGGLQEGAKGVADHYCALSEVCGDPVSQLHKIAFEVYDPAKGMPEPGTPGATGAFLSCMGEKVNTYRPVDGRQWNTPPLPTSPILPGSPVVSTPVSMGGNGDYFNGAPGATSVTSEPASPSSSNDFTNDGGRVKKGKRSTSSAGGLGKNPTKGRRRPTSAGSVSSRRGSGSDAGASSGALWQIDIGETSVWTIVGTDQVRYNFYVPPVLFDNQNAPQTGSFPIPTKPVTPFPGVVKYLPPDRAAEAPKSNCAQSRGVLAKPHPHISKMLTVYGENFNKADPVHIFFGAEPSPYVEIRCTEVLGCLPPEQQVPKRRSIIMIRPDGVVFPSSVMFP
ncbi:LAG1-DNAbind-domain-containing protein [Coniophora puteana RWD-64-598 SS2]|uniref:LAG1-DNAbind-domain-containing protein n=1 Tax=Coniophora puteana (strain RWD-64-598) TaxID=741705 RepID=A0A5M3MUD4_CONPW|nr:LAG1-DNAbind-domain-containing protein [Coniophora puteana RWD-64-598 SS2]EIW82739.1 LAG1-DNAbind-domain-containing protein [Coniophora puteana RWD-64-598 SS2]